MPNFLYQILIGAELLIRLRKEPAGANYKGIVTDNISALLVVSSLWMQHVTVQGPKEGPHKYLIYAHDQQRHAEALIKFAEAMSWPYLVCTRPTYFQPPSSLDPLPQVLAHILTAP